MQFTSENAGQATNRSQDRTGQVSDGMSIGIDFVVVAESHVLLFNRLKHYVHGESEGDEGEEFVEHARGCELKAWLQGEGENRFGQLQAFGQLRDIHEKFHDEAQAVLAHLHAGSWIAAEQMCKREFSQSLRRLLITLTELNEVLKKEGCSIS